MRRLALALGLAAASLVSTGAAAELRVLLVGIDGASWPAIDPLLAAGKMPTLAGIMERGVHADLETVEPVISPTVWTSIATGQPPAVHGIQSFFGDARDVRVPTLFERMAVQGVRVGLYGYLTTWPPRALPDGFIAPAWLRRDDRTTPPDLFERAGPPAYRYSIEGARGRPDYHRLAFEELRQKPVQWNALARAMEPEVGAVTFYALDALSHRFWADSYPASFDAAEVARLEPEFRDTVQNAYVALDAALAVLVETLPENAAIVLASDHGFRAHDGFQRRWAFSLREWLAAAGLEEGEAFRVESEFGIPVFTVLPGPAAERDATVDRIAAHYASFETEAGEPLFQALPLDLVPRTGARERSWLERIQQWAVKRFLAWNGYDLDNSTAHALVIAFPRESWETVWPDGRIRIGERVLPARDVVYGDGFTGDHDPTGIFVAAGGPIRQEAGRGDVSVLEIGPLLCWLGGAPIPDDVAAALPERLLDADALAARPPRTVAASALARLPEPEAPESVDADVRERLRSMGYVE